jgi:hypothetical protein
MSTILLDSAGECGRGASIRQGELGIEGILEGSNTSPKELSLGNLFSP